MPTLTHLLSDIRPGSSQQVGSLRLTPLLKDSRAPQVLDYILVNDAVGKDQLELSEISEEGVVSQLSATNRGDVAILIINGEELIGAKQNRIVNSDVLLRAHGKAALPVSCVERGRWDETPGPVASGGYSPSSVRGSTSRSVSDSLLQHGQAIADQHEVWQAVDELHDSLNTDSVTDAMADAFAQRAPDIESLRAKFECPENAVGLVAEIDGEILAVDLFDRPGIFQAFWNRLLTAHAIEALAQRSRTTAVSKRDTTTLLKRIGEADWFDLPGVDAGVDWRFLDTELVGSALVFEDSILHLSAFPSGIPKDDEQVGPVVY